MTYVELDKVKVVIVGGYLDGSVRVFNMSTETIRLFNMSTENKPVVSCSSFIKHLQPITMVKYSSQHNILMLASNDFRISCWHLAINPNTHTLDLHKKFYIYAHHH